MINIYSIIPKFPIDIYNRYLWINNLVRKSSIQGELVHDPISTVEGNAEFVISKKRNGHLSF